MEFAQRWWKRDYSLLDAVQKSDKDLRPLVALLRKNESSSLLILALLSSIPVLSVGNYSSRNQYSASISVVSFSHAVDMCLVLLSLSGKYLTLSKLFQLFLLVFTYTRSVRQFFLAVILLVSQWLDAAGFRAFMMALARSMGGQRRCDYTHCVAAYLWAGILSSIANGVYSTVLFRVLVDPSQRSPMPAMSALRAVVQVVLNIYCVVGLVPGLTRLVADGPLLLLRHRVLPPLLLLQFIFMLAITVVLLTATEEVSAYFLYYLVIALTVLPRLLLPPTSLINRFDDVSTACAALGTLVGISAYDGSLSYYETEVRLLLPTGPLISANVSVMALLWFMRVTRLASTMTQARVQDTGRQLVEQLKRKRLEGERMLAFQVALSRLVEAALTSGSSSWDTIEQSVQGLSHSLLLALCDATRASVAALTSSRLITDGVGLEMQLTRDLERYQHEQQALDREINAQRFSAPVAGMRRAAPMGESAQEADIVRGPAAEPTQTFTYGLGIDAAGQRRLETEIRREVERAGGDTPLAIVWSGNSGTLLTDQPNTHAACPAREPLSLTDDFLTLLVMMSVRQRELSGGENRVVLIRRFVADTLHEILARRGAEREVGYVQSGFTRVSGVDESLPMIVPPSPGAVQGPSLNFVDAAPTWYEGSASLALTLVGFDDAICTTVDSESGFDGEQPLPPSARMVAVTLLFRDDDTDADAPAVLQLLVSCLRIAIAAFRHVRERSLRRRGLLMAERLLRDYRMSVGRVAYQLQAPLRALRLLLARREVGKAADYARLLVTLIDRAASGGTEAAAASLSDVVEAALQLVEPLALGAGVVVSVSVDRRLGDRFRVNQLLLLQSLFSVLANAVQHSARGQRVALSVTPLSDRAIQRHTREELESAAARLPVFSGGRYSYITDASGISVRDRSTPDTDAVALRLAALYSLRIIQPGFMRLTAAYPDDPEGTQWVEFAVWDNGQGLPPRVVEQLSLPLRDELLHEGAPAPVARGALDALVRSLMRGVERSFASGISDHRTELAGALDRAMKAHFRGLDWHPGLGVPLVEQSVALLGGQLTILSSDQPHAPTDTGGAEGGIAYDAPRESAAASTAVIITVPLVAV